MDPPGGRVGIRAMICNRFFGGINVIYEIVTAIVFGTIESLEQS